MHGDAAGHLRSDAKKVHFGNGPKKSVMEAVVAWIASESRGMKMNVSLDNPKEKEAYEIGKKMFFYRAGPHDFSCATCHSHDGPSHPPAGPAETSPIRGTRSAPIPPGPGTACPRAEVRTMQHRISTAIASSVSPSLGYASDAVSALYDVPGPQRQRRDL